MEKGDSVVSSCFKERPSAVVLTALHPELGSRQFLIG